MHNCSCYPRGSGRLRLSTLEVVGAVVVISFLVVTVMAPNLSAAAFGGALVAAGISVASQVFGGAS